MTAPRIRVTIDEVVVSGLPPAEARHAVRALDAHLLTLLADPATRLPLHDTSVPTLRPSPAQPANGQGNAPGSGAHLGRAAAGAIHAAVQTGRGGGG
jgi:hypothetical protein